MNLTGELKDKVERVETMEEKKNIIADAGMELTDEELEGVAGGYELEDGRKIECPYCHCPTFHGTTISKFTIMCCDRCEREFDISSYWK